MGREFASASARWCHLLGVEARPEIVAVSNRSPAPFDWFRQHFPAVRQYAHDYRELLANPAVEAVYVAVPHHLHQEVCCAAIEAGKHLMAEKPVGIDLAANRAIADCAARHPELFVRCASQWIFYPAAQRIGELLEHGAVGRDHRSQRRLSALERPGSEQADQLEAHDRVQRRVRRDGRPGHARVCPALSRRLDAPQRAGHLVGHRQGATRRPRVAACRAGPGTTPRCCARPPIPASGEPFPLTLKMQRIAPGQKNTWYLEILGTAASVRFSTRDPKRLELLEYTGGEPVWGHLQTGHETAFKTITGPIFEFGFADSILQMWAAFLHELVHGQPAQTLRRLRHARGSGA